MPRPSELGREAMRAKEAWDKAAECALAIRGADATAQVLLKHERDCWIELANDLEAREPPTAMQPQGQL